MNDTQLIAATEKYILDLFAEEKKSVKIFKVEIEERDDEIEIYELNALLQDDSRKYSFQVMVVAHDHNEPFISQDLRNWHRCQECAESKLTVLKEKC